MYSKDQIEAGIKLVSAWYEGWKLDEIDVADIIHAIEESK